MHTCTLVIFKSTFMMDPHLLFLRFLQNLYTNVMKIAQYQDVFIQYNEGFNFTTGKASAEFKDAHVTIPEGAPPITPHTKANIRNGYVIPQESPIYRKSEKYKIFR